MGPENSNPQAAKSAQEAKVQPLQLLAWKGQRLIPVSVSNFGSPDQSEKATARL